MKASVSLKLGAAQAALAYTSIASAYLYNTTITTQYGDVQGIPALNATCCSYLDGWESVTVWKGIPFAANTGGANRWKSPQPRAAWNETLVADTFGSACPAGTTPPGGADSVVDEDCLNLNIWTSANSTAEKRPVMIWSYPAGANGAWSMFDGGAMALQDIVVVTYNYRTGPYGWLALPELYEESGNVTTGNYGLLDQIGALKWVHENIADFGGDPNRITTVGQSAGSAAVYHTVNSPLAKGLIVGAIAQSGIREPRDPASTSLAEGYNNMSTSIQLSQTLMSALNVTTLAQLRQTPADAINVASGFTGFSNWRGTLDGYALPTTYLNQLSTGPANDVPLLTGNTADESGASPSTNTTWAAFNATLLSTYGAALAPRFLSAFATSSSASNATNVLARTTSLLGTHSFARLWSGSATAPVYTYSWTHAPPGQDAGAYHMSEIPYVFNNLYGTDLPWEEADYDIARTLNAYWANFVKSGDPNGAGLGAWTPSVASRREVFHLGPEGEGEERGGGEGWAQVEVATDEQAELLEEFWAGRNASSL